MKKPATGIVPPPGNFIIILDDVCVTREAFTEASYRRAMLFALSPQGREGVLKLEAKDGGWTWISMAALRTIQVIPIKENHLAKSIPEDPRSGDETRPDDIRRPG
jgi:hypothetical protein